MHVENVSDMECYLQYYSLDEPFENTFAHSIILILLHEFLPWSSLSRATIAAEKLRGEWKEFQATQYLADSTKRLTLEMAPMSNQLAY